MEWLKLPPYAEDTCRRRHTNASQDSDTPFRATLLPIEMGNARRPPPGYPLGTPTKETQTLFEAGHGTAPDLVYARGGPTTLNPDLTNVNKK
jgi:hypothetical protein